MPLIYTSPLLFNTIFGILLALFVLRNRSGPGARALTILILAAALWSAGYAFEFLAPQLDAKLFWAKFQYFGIATIPLAWLLFSFRLLGSPEWSARVRRYLALLSVLPALTVVLVWTNELHGLIWRDMQLQPYAGIEVLEVHHGPWFWVYVAYSYLLLFAGSAHLLRRLFGAARLYRWQLILALGAVVVPWLGNLIYISGRSPIEHLDLTPFAITIAGLLFTLTLFRFRLADLVPIAQQTVFAGLADCILVLDPQDRVIDWNPAALKLIAHPEQRPHGRPVGEVAPELAPWVAQAQPGEEFRVAIAGPAGPEPRFYDLRITPLMGPYPRPIGRLVVCHEITELKQEQARLERARAELEQDVSNRTKELGTAVAQLQAELGERTLAEQRFEDVVESAPDAMILVDQDRRIILVNVEAERLFGYSRAELLGRNVELLIPPHQREIHRGYMREYGAGPAVRRMGSERTFVAQRKNGSEFPVELSLGPLHTANGVWVACEFRDVTERRQAEQAQQRLMEELQQSHEQLRALTFRLQEVREDERREIATELHDRIGQNLTALNLNLQIVRNQLATSSSVAVLRRLIDSLDLVEETTRQVRGVMANLHPPVLDEYGLFPAVKWYGDDFAQRTGIATRVTGDDRAPRLPPKVELILFRLVQEALNNVAKHAQASQVEIVVARANGGVRLSVKDNGLGFDPQAVQPSPDEPHWGLISLQQRVASIGGQLRVQSAPGRGTEVSVTVAVTPERQEVQP
jgi:PAS domain S-box-containing protein